MRRLDHVNLLASDVTVNKNFMMEHLGFRLREHIVMKDGTEAGAWISVSPLVHEIAFMRDGKRAKGRLHHICYWYGYPHDLNNIADVFREVGIKIEAGPGKHGISQAMFMYVLGSAGTGWSSSATPATSSLIPTGSPSSGRRKPSRPASSGTVAPCPPSSSSTARRM